MNLQNFWATLKSFFPQHGQHRAYDLKLKIENGELICRKEYLRAGVTLTLHQGIEPFNPRYGKIIDFEVENACFVFEFHQMDEKKRNVLIDHLRELFDYSYFRTLYHKEFLFSMLRDMEFDDARFEKLFPKLEKILVEHDKRAS